MDEEVSSVLIGIEWDLPEYFFKQLKEARRERLRAKTHKFRIYKGNLIEDVR